MGLHESVGGVQVPYKYFWVKIDLSHPRPILLERNIS
jgi:hypothetical protein